MREAETHDDVIAEMRDFKCRNLQTGKLEKCSAIANFFADRLEAANKRESGLWLNGDDYEYESAYCSKCGYMEYAGWYTHAEAKLKIEDFYQVYRYCPNCGAQMTGGLYKESKRKRKRNNS